MVITFAIKLSTVSVGLHYISSVSDSRLHKELCQSMTIPSPVMSQSHARTWRLSLKDVQGDEDETEDSSQRGSYVYNSLSPHQRKGATIIQDVKQTGTAIAECPYQNHRCQDLKVTKRECINV